MLAKIHRFACKDLIRPVGRIKGTEKQGIFRKGKKRQDQKKGSAFFHEIEACRFFGKGIETDKNQKPADGIGKDIQKRVGALAARLSQPDLKIIQKH